MSSSTSGAPDVSKTHGRARVAVAVDHLGTAMGRMNARSLWRDTGILSASMTIALPSPGACLMLSLFLLGACGGSKDPTPGGGAGGTANGGAGGKASAGGTAGSGGTAGGACQVSECLRAFQCVRACGGPVEYSGCCPCEPPLFDDFGGTTCGLSAFCTGSTPRMVVNGATTTPNVSGQILPLDCCRAGRFVVTTSDFTQPIAVQWRVEAGASVMPPAAVDLGSLPSGWSVALNAGCSVTSAGCLGALDNFSAGFSGSLSVSNGDGGPGQDMNLCLRFAEPADKPGTYVHTLDLYAPHVSTSS
jgi:hypothetical protein